MTPQLILYSFLGYTFLLFLIGYITSRKSDNESYFIGNRKSPWYVVAYGMVGASLSGVTFISVPGWVGDTQFSYMMVVIGYLLGYLTIALVLLPLYYRLQLTSIYTYLLDRFGFWSYKTGAFYFLLSRIIGASFRMFLVVNILQIFVFDSYGVPFWLTVIIFMVLINLYTFKGGIKTIVWTDTLQTTFMLTAVVLTVIFIKNQLDLNIGALVDQISDSRYSKMIFTDWQDKRNYIKQFFSGTFIAIVMTGLDQDMMQKNLTCKNKWEAQKNMLVFSMSFLFTVVLFLSLGVMLYIFAREHGISIPENTDDLYPMLALKYFGLPVGIAFLLGITAAAYSSADSALTALTTSFTVDFLKIHRYPEEKKRRIKMLSHLMFSVLLIAVILVFDAINNQSIVVAVFTVAGYTYGPILGLFLFGMYSSRKVKDKWVPYIGIFAPVLCYFISSYSEVLFNGYQFGFELLILNGAITMLGLLLISEKSAVKG